MHAPTKLFPALVGIILLFIVSFMVPAELIAKDQPAYQFELSWKNPVTHLYDVGITVQKAAGKHTDFVMPAWRPGRYILQNFAAAISRFQATDENGKPLEWQKTDKDTWRVQNPVGQTIRISYQSYANIMEQASSYLGPEMAYFNPFTLFMYVHDRLEAPCTLTVPAMPANWKSATQLIKTNKHNVFTAPTFHYLMDSPTILSPTLKQFSFKQDGVDYWVHFQGKYLVPDGEEKDFLGALGKIMREHTAVFGELPLKEYHFIYLLTPFQYASATEHSYSAMYAISEGVAANARALGNLHGISSHEVFHLWNVKRLRPAAMYPYRYDKEAYTNLYWLAEGFTSYYDDLGLVRAGLLTRPQYFDEISRLVSRVENSYTQQVFSVDEISYDSWLYTSRYVMPYINGGFYYDAGARLGLLLDLQLRRVSNGKVDLDAVMKYLYNTYYKNDKGVPDDGVEKACTALTGQSFTTFFKQYAASPAPYDLKAVLEPMGLQVAVTDEPKGGLRRIGIDRSEMAQGGVLVNQLRPNGDAAAAGVPDRAIIIKIDGKAVGDVNFETWGEDFKTGQAITIDVVFNGESQTFTVSYTGNSVPKRYTIAPKDGIDAKWLDAWLGSKAK